MGIISFLFRKKNTTPVKEEREPVVTWNDDTPILVMYVSNCANVMIAGEVNYLQGIGKFEKFFKKEKAGDYVLERISLIVSFLSSLNIQTRDGWEKLWLKEISSNYGISGSITESSIKSLFDERIDFYTEELKVQQSLTTPLPNEIISQLYKPMISGKISHKISAMNGFTYQENMFLWNIITSEVGKMMGKVQKNRDFIYSSKNNL
jgi:hypothetical protein